MALEVSLLKTPYEVSFSGNKMPFLFAFSPYGTTERSQDIRLQVRVLVEQNFGSGIFTEVKNQNFYPDNFGKIEMDVCTIIDPYLTYYTPAPSLTVPVQAMNQRKRYRIDYLIQKDNALVGSVTSSSIFYAIKGGMAYDEFHPSEYFTQCVVEDKKPLAFTLSDEAFRLIVNRFLFWLYPEADNAEQTVLFEIMLEDGSIIPYPLDKKITCGKWGICCVPIGFEQMKLGDQLATNQYAKAYRVSIEATGGLIAETEFIPLDYRNFYNSKQLLYRNSVGGLETIELRGQIDFDAEYTRQQALRTVPPSYFSNLLLMPQNVVSATEENSKEKGDTGFISQAAADKLRDLFLSTEVYQLQDGKLLPIVISNKTVKFFANRDSLISILIEWMKAYTNEFYTPSGLLPLGRTCPAVDKLVVKQKNKNYLQIMYALPTPYDRVEIEIIADGVSYFSTYTGNVNVLNVFFVNPATVSPVDITIKARVLCNENVTPVDAGAWTTVVLSVVANSLPIASDDTYAISSGYSTGVVLTPSALANDYDPDGDAIEAVADTGATNAGGTFAITSAGVVTYTPPSSSYQGQDYFDYEIREVGGSTTVTARVYINVGSAGTGVFAKLVVRNAYSYNAAFNSYNGGELWLDFYSDPSGTTPLDVTAMALTVEVRDVETSRDEFGSTTTNTTDTNYSPTGDKIKIYEGDFYRSDFDLSWAYSREWSKVHTIQPGAGYSVI